MDNEYFGVYTVEDCGPIVHIFPDNIDFPDMDLDANDVARLVDWLVAWQNKP